MAKVASEYTDGNSCPDSCYVEFDYPLKNHFNTQSNKNMNAKQLIQITAKAAPPLLIGVGIYYGLKWLFSAEDTETKPATMPANTGMESCRKEAETPTFRPIPAEIPVKSNSVLVSPTPKPFIPPLSIPPAPIVSMLVPATVAIPKTVTQVPPTSRIKRKFVTREDLASVFQRGARALSRQNAVTALKNLGFGKTAAYDALSPDGRFSTWLQFASDGIITWKD
jgi:hypothetical protein